MTTTTLIRQAVDAILDDVEVPRDQNRRDFAAVGADIAGALLAMARVDDEYLAARHAALSVIEALDRPTRRDGFEHLRRELALARYGATVVTEQLAAAFLAALAWTVTEWPAVIGGLGEHLDRVFVQRQLLATEPVDTVIGVLMLAAAVAVVSTVIRSLILRAIVR